MTEWNEAQKGRHRAVGLKSRNQYRESNEHRISEQTMQQLAQLSLLMRSQKCVYRDCLGR